MATALAALACIHVGAFAQSADTRSISFFNIHNNETLDIEYKRAGRFVPAAMKKINWILRDWRRNEATEMDPALIDLLWEIHSELGSQKPIHIISGYRAPATNEALRSRGGGQARYSQHTLGKACDVHFPDVPLFRMRYSALLRERGGVGYYPTSGIPFVHVDTGRVRAWPRLPRPELALLFPDGRTQHRPADDGDIGPSDARAAQASDPQLAKRVAEYFDLRRSAARRTLVASIAPPPRLVRPPRSAARPSPARPAPATVLPEDIKPTLVSEPRLIDPPSRLVARLSPDDRLRLGQLAALATGRTVTRPPPSRDRLARAEPLPPPPLPAAEPTILRVAESAAYDPEHPEELSYRPFPVAPYLTLTASPDDPALVTLVQPDSRQTFDMLDTAGSMPPMYLRPTEQVVRVLWAQSFIGNGQGPGERPQAVRAPGALADRKVRTEKR